jgi:hypothetical protein
MAVGILTLKTSSSSWVSLHHHTKASEVTCFDFGKLRNFRMEQISGWQPYNLVTCYRISMGGRFM